MHHVMSSLNTKGPIPMKVIPNPMPMMTVAFHTNSNLNNNSKNVIHTTAFDHNNGKLCIFARLWIHCFFARHHEMKGTNHWDICLKPNNFLWTKA